MKKLTFLVLLFFIFSCDKDEPKSFSEQHTEQEIFNAVIGTWCPYRLAYDEDFKQIEHIENDSCWKKYNVTFNVNSTANAFVEWLNEDFQGSFYIEKQQRLNSQVEIEIVFSKGMGIFLSPTTIFSAPILHNYTDSTLVFSSVSYDKDGQSIDHLYSEFKRVK